MSITARKSFGIFFISISVAIIVGSLFSEIIELIKLHHIFHFIAWTFIFGIIMTILIIKYKRIFLLIRNRMKTSMKWPLSAKIINGLCWTIPFLLIPLFPSIYQFLILAGIGLGNLSTFLLTQKYSNIKNYEQFIVGILSILFIPLAIYIDNSLLSSQNIAIIISRLMIAISYGIGGIFALVSKY